MHKGHLKLRHLNGALPTETILLIEIERMIAFMQNDLVGRLGHAVP